jgi:hypothetical protein
MVREISFLVYSVLRSASVSYRQSTVLLLYRIVDDALSSEIARLTKSRIFPDR